MVDYPDDLVHPVKRGDAALLGVGWRELGGPLWRSPYRGVHVWSATDPNDPLQRAFDAAGLLRDPAAIGGWAAARIGGATELDGRGPTGQASQPVIICLPPSRRMKRGPTIRVLRSPLAEDDVTTVCGVRVTTPLRTAFDLARTETPVEAVVALDYLSRGRPEFLDALATYLDEHSHLNGSSRARAALRLATWRSRSAGETRLRLLWRLDAGLPAPVINATVRLADDGFLLGISDLLDIEAGMAGEYDGATHRTADQHARDNVREEGFEGAGLVVVRFGGVDLGRERRRAIHRLRAGWQLGLSRRASPRLWTWDESDQPPRTPHW